MELFLNYPLGCFLLGLLQHFSIFFKPEQSKIRIHGKSGIPQNSESNASLPPPKNNSSPKVTFFTFLLKPEINGLPDSSSPLKKSLKENHPNLKHNADGGAWLQDWTTGRVICDSISNLRWLVPVIRFLMALNFVRIEQKGRPGPPQYFCRFGLYNLYLT